MFHVPQREKIKESGENRTQYKQVLSLSPCLFRYLFGLVTVSSCAIYYLRSQEGREGVSGSECRVRLSFQDTPPAKDVMETIEALRVTSSTLMLSLPLCARTLIVRLTPSLVARIQLLCPAPVCSKPP